MNNGGIFLLGLLFVALIVNFGSDTNANGMELDEDIDSQIADYEAEMAQKEANLRAQSYEAQASGATVISSIAAMGVPSEGVWTNGYVYEFNMSGFWVSMCDQDDRIVGELYRMPANSSEKAMLEEAHMIMLEAESDRYDGLNNQSSMYISLAEDLVKDYGYQEFCIDGHPTFAVRELQGMV